MDINSAEIAAPVGHVAIEFNNLEIAVSRLLARILGRGDQETAAALGAVLSFDQKLRLVETLSTLIVTNPESVLEFRRLTARAKELNTTRNRLVHSEYLPVVDNNDAFLHLLLNRHRDAAKNGTIIFIDGSTSKHARRTR